MEKKIELDISTEGAIAVVAFRSASMCDSQAIADASNEIKAFIEKNRPSTIIFDFEDVKFFSSQLLGVMLDIRSKIKPYQGEVVISAIDPQLYRVFKITNLDSIFRFFPDKDQATEAVISE